MPEKRELAPPNIRQHLLREFPSHVTGAAGSVKGMLWGKNKFKVARIWRQQQQREQAALSAGTRQGGGFERAKSNKKDANAPEQGAQSEILSGQLPFRLAVQPVRAKYGGQGLAKPSTFLNLTDKDFNDKFEKLFYEHIKGWAGNSYTKSRKKQEQSGMLWKQRFECEAGIGAAPSS